MTHPYTSGWPLWPFTRLTPKEKAKLLKAMERQRSVKRLDDLEEAPL